MLRFNLTSQQGRAFLPFSKVCILILRNGYYKILAALWKQQR